MGMAINRARTKSQRQVVNQQYQATLVRDAAAESIEARIKRIEHRLSLDSAFLQSTSSSNSFVPGDQVTESNRQAGGTPLATPSTSPAAYQNEQPERHYLRLPDRRDVISAIKHYFQTANNILPLFDELCFMEIFNEWYNVPSTRTRVDWAAIQVVVALGLRTECLEGGSKSPGSTKMANECLSNAQSVLAELATHDEDLVGLQVLLGIILLLQYSSDQKPASVVILSAMRLVHRLEVHSSVPSQPLSSKKANQRSRVFWIAYALDKEISLRVKTPSIQSDHDIDLPLPPIYPGDGVGLIWTIDGCNSMNYFRLRIELAHIQGTIYDWLYSNRAARIDEPERVGRITQIQSKLNKWHERIPASFRMDCVSFNVGLVELVQITKLYHGYLIAKVMAHGFYSKEAEWMKGASSSSTITIDDLALTQYQFGAARGNMNQTPPSASGWEDLVQISRGCMKLLHAANQFEELVWQCSCGYSSALLILLANLFLGPSHLHMELDRSLCDKSMKLLDEILEITPDKAFIAVRKLAEELTKMADNAMQTHRSGQDDNFEHLISHNTDENSMFEVQDWDFDITDDQITSVSTPP